MVAQVQSESIYPVMPYLYKSGFNIRNNFSFPGSKIYISDGICRDSRNLIDMSIGSLFTPPNQGNPFTNYTLLNGYINGVNGLDTGTVSGNTMYAAYIVGDSNNKNPTGTLLSLASNLGTPTMPSGYDSYRLIGYWATNIDGSFWNGTYSASWGQNIIFSYDANQPTSVTAGNATTYTAINLSSLVPPFATPDFDDSSNVMVNGQFIFNANAIGDSLSLNTTQDFGETFKIVSPVAGSSALYYGYFNLSLYGGNFSTFPRIFYKVSTASASVAINISGFTMSV